MDDVVREIRRAARRLLATPGSTFAAMAALTLGIGAAVTIYTIDRAVLLRDLPLERPAQLVLVERTIAKEPTLTQSPADLLDLRHHDELFSGVSASAGFRSLFQGAAESKYVHGESVTPDYFETLGATPALGETFKVFGDRTDVAVVSWQFWQSSLGADPQVVGKVVRLDGTGYTVVGVMKRELALLEADVWLPGPQGLPHMFLPMSSEELRTRRDLAYITIVARLRDGLQLSSAQGVVQAATREIVSNYPASFPDVRFTLRSFKDKVVAGAQQQLVVLSAGVALVFLLVCLSVTTLLVGRSMSRSEENALRLALGASRVQVLAVPLSECTLLAAVGGAFGVLISVPAVRYFLALAPAMRRSDEASLDPAVITFALFTTIVAAILAGLLPAVKTFAQDPRRALGSNAPRTLSRERNLAWKILVIVQVAVMVFLVGGSMELGRRFLRLRDVNLGFDPHGLLVASVVLPSQSYSDPRAIEGFFASVLGRLSHGSGADFVGAAFDVPLHPGRLARPFAIVGGAGEDGIPAPTAWYSVISPGFFRTIGTPIVSGRDFTDADVGGAQPVAVINNAMASRYWPGSNPIGSELRFGNELVRIVGVVAGVKHSLLDGEVDARVYRPYKQSPVAAMSIVLRSRTDLPRLAQVVRGTAKEVDPSVPAPVIASMEESLREAMRPTRYLFVTVGAFGAIAALVAALGLYGLLAFQAHEEEYDVAIRLALGAPRSRLVRSRMIRGLRTAAAGIATGIIALSLGGPAMERLLPAGPGVRDSATSILLVVAVISIFIAMLSGAVPAARIMAVSIGQVNRRF